MIPGNPSAFTIILCVKKWLYKYIYLSYYLIGILIIILDYLGIKTIGTETLAKQELTSPTGHKIIYHGRISVKFPLYADRILNCRIHRLRKCLSDLGLPARRRSDIGSHEANFRFFSKWLVWYLISVTHRVMDSH